MARVTFLEIFSDGSGAPAKVFVEGWCFGANYLRQARLDLLTGGNRAPSKRVRALAYHAYERALRERADAAWFAANAAMYAHEAKENALSPSWPRPRWPFP